MLVAHSKNRRARAVDAGVSQLLRGVSEANLLRFVESLGYPRHYLAGRAANRRARDWLVRQLRDFGYAPTLQGSYDNVVATSEAGGGPHLLLGAHYDSVPGTPGADDNGSAVAVCLECARLVKAHGIGGVAVAFFNREEDGLLGSAEFVEQLAGRPGSVAEAHVFEMVGYRDRRPGSQRVPPGLPGVAAPDAGDFLGLLANRRSNGVAEELLRLAATYVPESRVVALKIYLGVEKYFGHLHRSDHAPFWKAGIPAVMWTDTSEFRNPHYHRATDTPETLDYEFMAQVARVALARAATRSRALRRG
jgi:hypothetical protein